MLTNQAAFLDMLAHGEGTDLSVEPYRVCYARQHVIVSFADHPAITGEWMGEIITAGIYAGERSTAAGRYQINKPTWLEVKLALGLRGLDLFAPQHQDDGALWLIKRAGALDMVNAGQIESAVAKCRNVWASLPGGDSGQPQANFSALMNKYASAGGSFA